MISGYFWVFVLAAYQVAIILAPHPEQIRRPWLRVLVRLLGRLSLFRHQAGPRTLHVPLTRQPWWSPLELERLLGQVRLEELRQGPRQPAAPDEGPAPLQRRAPQIISWLQPAAALLLVLGLAGCTVLTQPRKVAGQGLKSDAALVSELRASAKAEELRLAAAAGTKEEARARVLAYRGGIDLAEKLLERSRQNLRDVARALGLDAPPVPAAPSPAPLPGGAP